MSDLENKEDETNKMLREINKLKFDLNNFEDSQSASKSDL